MSSNNNDECPTLIQNGFFLFISSTGPRRVNYILLISYRSWSTVKNGYKLSGTDTRHSRPNLQIFLHTCIVCRLTPSSTATIFTYWFLTVTRLHTCKISFPLSRVCSILSRRFLCFLCDLLSSSSHALFLLGLHASFLFVHFSWPNKQF